MDFSLNLATSCANVSLRFPGNWHPWREGRMLSLLGTLASHEGVSYKYELYIHCKMSAPPPNRRSRHIRSAFQCFCQPTKCSLGNFKMQTLKKNTLNPNGMGLRECLSQPRIALCDFGSLPWAVQSFRVGTVNSNTIIFVSIVLKQPSCWQFNS